MFVFYNEDNAQGFIETSWYQQAKFLSFIELPKDLYLSTVKKRLINEILSVEGPYY